MSPFVLIGLTGALTRVAPGWVQVGLGIFALAGFAALVLAYFKTKLNESTITLLKQNNDAQRDRITQIEGEIEIVKHLLDTANNKIANLETENRFYRDLVTGERDHELMMKNILKILQAVTGEGRGDGGGGRA